VSRKAIYFCLFLLLETVIFAGLLTWVILTNNPLATTLLVIDCVASLPLLMWLAFAALWNPMIADYSVKPPLPEAVSHRFQSFSLGIVNMGLSIHAAADADYLHLTPIRLFRWLGAQSCSIPWTSMEPIGRKGNMAKVDGRFVIHGPKWCMQLASSEVSGE